MFFLFLFFFHFSKHINMLIVFFEREDVDRRQFCRCIIGVSGVPRGPYCICKTKMVACALRIKCCVLESCCSFDGSFASRSTITCTTCYRYTIATEGKTTAFSHSRRVAIQTFRTVRPVPSRRALQPFSSP